MKMREVSVPAESAAASRQAAFTCTRVRFYDCDLTRQHEINTAASREPELMPNAGGVLSVATDSCESVPEAFYPSATVDKSFFPDPSSPVGLLPRSVLVASEPNKTDYIFSD